VQFQRVAFVLAAAAACTGPSGPTVEGKTFDPCTPPTVVVGADATPAQASGVTAALALWRARGAPDLGTASGPQVPVQFQTASPLSHGYYDPDAGIIYINNDLVSPDTLAIVIAHELGHAFGLVHIPTDVRRSVMNPGNLEVVPDEEDERALAAVWGACSSSSRDGLAQPSGRYPNR
jgi:hypothetical protein